MLHRKKANKSSNLMVLVSRIITLTIEILCHSEPWNGGTNWVTTQWDRFKMQFKKVPLSIEQKTASREAVSNWNCKMQFLDDFSKELHFRLQTLRKTTFSACDTKLHYSIAYKIVLHSKVNFFYCIVTKCYYWVKIWV